MIAKFLSFIKQNWSVSIIFLIALYLSLVNYVPGTFLTGWDTLHPEFNLSLYWSRIIDGVWQEHQGLGAAASQAHASEIPRVLILHILGLFLRMHQLRYGYAFLMLILGPLGLYAFTKKIILKDLPALQKEIGAFAGGLFYLLNLGTLQHFYVPLEMFLTHYGLLPWVLTFAVKFFDTGYRAHLKFFAITSFFLISQAHTPTLFYAYILIFTLFFGAALLVTAFSPYAGAEIKLSYVNFKKDLVRFCILLFYTLLLNAFWLMPNIYFVVKHSDEISMSKIHHLFSTEAFLQNKEFGNIKDTAILKNFLFNWGEHVGNAQFGDLLDEWDRHLNYNNVYYIGYAYFVLVIVGLAISLYKKSKYGVSTMFVALGAMFFIFNVNPPFGFIFEWVQNTFPIFREAFRFPFTKFSIFLIFSYSVFISVSIAKLISLIGSISGGGKILQALRSFLYFSVYILLIFSLVYYMYPAFRGNLLSKSMKVSIPQRYFELFSYLDSQSDYGRVATLPIQSFWGWVYNNWNQTSKLGYQGAGFLWFGIKQPLLDREFDRWNLLNENYYREFSTAIYSENVSAVEMVLDKYKVKWVLLDTSVIAPGADSKLLFYPQIKSLLEGSSKLKIEKDFGEGLYLYKYNSEVSYSRIDLLTSYGYADDSLFKEYSDPMYTLLGDYISNPTSFNSSNYGNKKFPYVGLTKYDESVKSDYIFSDADNIYITNRLVFSSLNESNIDDLTQFDIYVKHLDGNLELELLSVSNLSFNQSLKLSLPLNEVIFDNTSLESLLLVLNTSEMFSLKGIQTAPEGLYLGSALINPSVPLKASLLNQVESTRSLGDVLYTLERCSGIGVGSSYSLKLQKNGFELSSKDTTACVTVALTQLFEEKFNSSYVLIKYKSETNGATPRICMLDTSSGLCINSTLYSGQDISYIDSQRVASYHIRFLSDNILGNEELYSKFSDIQAYSFEELLSTEFDITSLGTVQNEFLGKITFRKDVDSKGLVKDLNSNPHICSTGLRNFTNSYAKVIENYVHYRAEKDSLCDSFQFPSLKHNTGYILEVKSRNVEGMPLRVCVTNEYSKRCDLYVSLPANKEFITQYFFIPPMDDKFGYTVNVSNLVFGSNVSSNDLEYLSLTPITYNFLRSLHKNIEHNKATKLLVLNEAFEPGWIAVCGYNICESKHVLVNNWANGWEFKTDQDINSVKIIFWPQVLEYIGFVFAISALIFVFSPRRIKG